MEWEKVNVSENLNQAQPFQEQQIESQQALQALQTSQVNLNRYEQFKYDVYYLVEKKTAPHGWSKAFHSFMILLIILNVTMVIMETIESFSVKYAYECRVFELITVIIFTIEYVIRIWCCNASDRWKGTCGRFKFMISPMMIIDLISILPFFIPMILSIDLIYLRIVRLTRIFRLFKLGYYSQAFDVIARVFSRKKEYLVLSFLFIFILLIFSSSLMYVIEHHAQPDTFSSIPATMWWAIVTLTTIGYGDVYPITPLGKALCGIIALLGIAVFTLPAAILSVGFFEEVKCNVPEKKVIKCPHCGHEIDEEN